MGNEKKNVGRFVNLGVPEELDKRLNQYILKVSQKLGEIPHAIRTKIGRMALEEWCEAHEDNLDEDFIEKLLKY